MAKGKTYPKGMSDLGRLVDHLAVVEKEKKKKDYLESRKENAVPPKEK